MNRFLSILSLVAWCLLATAQTKAPVTVKVSSDTVKIIPQKTGIKPYESVITSKAQTKTGLFTVHRLEDKFYFEIPDSLMGREFLAISRYSKTPGGSPVYGGELANQQSLYWEKGPNKNLFLRVAILISASSDSTEAISSAVRNANLTPIVAAFDIKAYSKDHQAVVIDVTDFFKSENQVVSIDPSIKQRMKLGTLAQDRSYIDRINTFPLNTEIHTVKTYNYTSGGTGGFNPNNPPVPAGVETGVLTFEMNTSFLLLPKVPMRKRYLDERVGFFGDQYTSYEDNSQKSAKTTFAVRWRLEVKPQDLDKFKRGELVEPLKPILYYIDPATPKKWRPYLMAGISDWQKAFEQAGFKNAISAREWPTNDTTMSMEDARYSVLRYFASPLANAYGPNVHDPRSGEILESHIGWYHNVMKLVHDWYMVQAGAIDPRARKMTFNDELMGNLIRFVSSHEIGHTLGLRHNMGASSTTPVEKLRDKVWVERNGHTPSIMDYARFNYVAQPEDQISEQGILPRIGAYDKWAIEWGYKPMPAAATPEAEKLLLLRSTTTRLGADKRLWFGGEGYFGDPRSQSEDLGDNSMKANSYGIKNLKRVIAGLPQWTKEEDDLQYNLNVMYGAVRDEYMRFNMHVLKNIGGNYFTNKTDMEQGPLFVSVPRKQQKEAVAYLNSQVFKTPLWLTSNYIVGRLGLRPLDEMKKINEQVFSRSINPASLLNVIASAQNSPDPYSLVEYLKDLEKGIWGELDTHTNINIYRRNLQKMYVDKMCNIIKPVKSNTTTVGLFILMEPESAQSDVPSVVRADLVALMKRVRAGIPATSDTASKYHLQDITVRLTKALSDKD